MGRATELIFREQIQALRNQGLSIVEISEQLSIPYGTVKHLCRRFKVSNDLQPKYKNCGRRPGVEFESPKNRALELRRQHPKWGAPRIRVEMQLEGIRPLPSVRVLQRFFRQNEAYIPRNRNCQPPIGRSQAPHNIWEVDAKERFRLLDGQPACYLTITDEKTGAWLEAPVFPL
jgi:hypothetical protein